MKNFMILAFLCLCGIYAKSQTKQALLIGKEEPDVLSSMRDDNDFSYSGLTEDSTGYHLTYVSKYSDHEACNFFFQNQICISVIYYYTKDKLPNVITSLNNGYKRTDDQTWVDNSLHYYVHLFFTKNDIIELGFRKM